jgi:hypothetical protein
MDQAGFKCDVIVEASSAARAFGVPKGGWFPALLGRRAER